MTTKKKHVSASLERHVRAPREHTWDVLLREIEAAGGGYVKEGDPPPHGAGAVLHLPLDSEAPPLVETVLSLEPPWRRVYEVTGDTGLDLYQGTFAIITAALISGAASSSALNADSSSRRRSKRLRS